jgi:hypothetical protein
MVDQITQKAVRIANEFFQEQVNPAYAIIGKGSVNQIAVVETGSLKAVIQMSNLSTHEEYVKEKWCIEQAAAVGIPGPEVLSVGKTGETAYMIQTFVEGENGEDCERPKAYIWGKVGEYAKHIHEIRTEGYGEWLADPNRGEFNAPYHEGFDGSWLSFMQYNINNLTGDDRLIKLEVITPSQSRKAKLLFEKLQKTTLNFGLNHSALSLKNTVINKEGRVFLLDWRSAEVNVVPHRDFVELLQHIILWTNTHFKHF